MLKIWRKRISQSVSQSISNKGVCRTSPATPGLLIIGKQVCLGLSVHEESPFFSKNFWNQKSFLIFTYKYPFIIWASFQEIFVIIQFLSNERRRDSYFVWFLDKKKMKRLKHSLLAINRDWQKGPSIIPRSWQYQMYFHSTLFKIYNIHKRKQVT